MHEPERAAVDLFTLHWTVVHPITADSPLRGLPNVVLTPHVGWRVDEVFHEFAEIAAEQLAAWLAGRLPPEEVLDPAAAEVPRDRLGTLAED